ncbi:uncharacterized histidine-rich protein DDB_G0274557-like [Ischnura elegans]|uniref:uncharacterized histidine-rich protein DDB_G0274557-like n=1 Tax=Ischnura elegans TaxID=197161 RepID=UPI001ED8955B|nr:uncharacterized histidine-rich protein DDB_G0274557-like [Ischnura elegans]
MPCHKPCYPTQQVQQVTVSEEWRQVPNYNGAYDVTRNTVVYGVAEQPHHHHFHLPLMHPGHHHHHHGHHFHLPLLHPHHHHHHHGHHHHGHHHHHC